MIAQHEDLHWTEARSKAEELMTERVLEAITQLPGATTLPAAVRAAQDQYGFTVAAANDAVETSLLPVQPNAPHCIMRP
ncbi:MAG: hypothetical protein ACYCVE_01780 [Gemmatimonadaceae bacterium]